MKHNKSKNNYIIFFIFFIAFFLLSQISVHAESVKEKSVLILNSCNNENSIVSGNKSRDWSSEIISSINSEFINTKKDVDVKVQYMDSNDNFGGEYWKRTYDLYKYKYKYKDSKFDVVITLNDNAFNFLLKYGDDLFPNIPVVFSGVYNFNKSMINNHPYFTGILKNPDVKSTIDIALKLHPNTKQIFAIIGKNSDSIYRKKTIEGLSLLYKDKVSFFICDDDDIGKVKEKINMLAKDTVIYFDGTFKDNGEDISLTKTTEILFKDSNIPIYSTYYIDLNKESVGGVITNGSDLGKEIGLLALRVLNGEKPSNIPVTEDCSHNYEFNYNKLKQFNIDLSALPKESEIVNKPTKFYNISKTQIFYLVVSSIFIITLAVFFIIINIYKRRLAERLLFDSESTLGAVMDSTPNIIYMRNSKGKFLKANNTVLNLLNISEEDFGNKSIDELSNLSVDSKHVLENWMNHDEETWKKGTMYRSEEVIQDNKNGIYKFYDTLRIPLFNDNGARRGLILFGLDITDNKHNEENEKLIKELMHYDKLKTNFFSNISHELRTPLNLIFSALQVIELKTESCKKEQCNIEKYIGIMRQNCYRLLRIIGNLIDITKIDAGHFFTQPFNKDIVNLVENIVLSIADYVESKGISITFDTEIEEKIMAFDPDAMERIILNLLSNSIKFTPSGGSIEVNIYDKLNSIVISVKDTGLGIPAEKQSLIFEKFIQVDKSLSRNREGSGIGLSLVKELVVMHNGTIELESTLGKGSEFRVELPVGLLPENKSCDESEIYSNESKIQTIKIEFSDIYN